MRQETMTTGNKQRCLEPTMISRCAAPLILCSITAPTAHAYVGPGAGLTMLGALWAVIVAIVFLLGGLVLWPLRALRRRTRKEARDDKDSAPGEETEASGSMPASSAVREEDQ